MIQTEPLYIVVTGEKQNRRAYFASRFQNHAQAFAGAFAHDPLRPSVEEYQMFTTGGLPARREAVQRQDAPRPEGDGGG
jgi:hypothetical protein